MTPILPAIRAERGRAQSLAMTLRRSPVRRLVRAVAVAAVAAALCVIVGACGPDDGGTPSAASDRTSYRGALITPQLEKPDFVLTDTADRPYDFRRETEGYLTLLYVGYTHCPDVCPTHMADIARVLGKMPPEIAGRIRVVMVTADPERDTPEVLRKWLDLFDKRFVGLTGSPEEISSLMGELGMEQPRKTDLGEGNYSVSHAAYVMAFTTDNVCRVVYPLGVTEADWVHDLLLLAREGSKGKS